MKNALALFGFLFLIITFTSCKSDKEKKAELVTNKYVRFVDSVTQKTTADAAANWSTIEKYFEKQSTELNSTIDQLENTAAFDAKIDSATAKYEAFRNSIRERKKNLKGTNLLEK
ncbi:hypothetical protein [Flavobacterium glaciei]|uniref:Uncharacterized protein n=1 Tax=Flavobacterium glaciei TaxID=386300 RepID=A0A562PRH7_9FLAO|nr:hypothetical protein [Flavobacterium glaciei]RDI53762.1 hypothetical protein DFR66_108113 [Flavobacterium glaciei]TWI46988.1 hypothetical protein IQ02_01823 [Flavobacterium glaciei]